MSHQPSVAQTIGRVQAWLAANHERSRAAIAEEAGVDEKTVRLACGPGWNPTVSTLQKFEAVIPANWNAGDPLPGAKRRKAA